MRIEGCTPTQMSEKREVTGGEVRERRSEKGDDRERTRVTDEFVLCVGNRLFMPYDLLLIHMNRSSINKIVPLRLTALCKS